MSKKKDNKDEKKAEQPKAVDPDLQQERPATPEEQIAYLNQQLQLVVNKANELNALCRHYETTINVLTGRLQELGGNA